MRKWRKGRQARLQLRRIKTKYLITVRTPVQSSKFPHGSWQRHCMTSLNFDGTKISGNYLIKRCVNREI